MGELGYLSINKQTVVRCSIGSFLGLQEVQLRMLWVSQENLLKHQFLSLQDQANYTTINKACNLQPPLFVQQPGD